MRRRIERLNQADLRGCHFTRPITELISSAGFDIKDVDVFYEQGAPKFAGADTLGVAVTV